MTNEEIITALGFDTATEEMKERVVENTRTIVELRVIGVVSELINDDQKDAFDAIRNSGDNQAMWDWLRDEVVGADVREVYEATLQDYIDDYKRKEFLPEAR